jgi:hypothetical protein
MLTGTYQFPTNSDILTESLPFTPGDITAGTENELQARTDLDRAFEVEWRKTGVAFDINCRVSRDCYLENNSSISSISLDASIGFFTWASKPAANALSRSSYSEKPVMAIIGTSL